LQDAIEQVQTWAQFLGPNIYVQAVAIAAIFIVVGKLADLVICRIIARLVSRSSNELDDKIIVLLHRPVFITFVLVGLAMATRRLELPESPTFATLGILRTISIFVWYAFFRGLVNLSITALRHGPASKHLHASMLPLMDTVVRVVLLARAIYFVFLAW
jgi:MscS family membrane protein